jgi:glycyl-tRNA synthetase beta chain
VAEKGIEDNGVNNLLNASLLFEIGTEDLPARFIFPAIQQMEQQASGILREMRIPFSGIKTYGTPRRLALIAEGLPRSQEDRTREVFGPSRKAAYDANGRPTKAAVGFAQSQGVSVEQLIIKSKDKGEYVAAVLEEKGGPVIAVLPEILKRIVLSLHLPKSMRWADGDLRFARPIRWLLALFDEETVSFDIDGIRSSNTTMGHRFLSPAAFKLQKISGYKSMLANKHVVVDQEERKKIIVDAMEVLLGSLGEKPVQDQELLETVVNLVEYPVPVLATFPAAYLGLPRELLITVMKGHQKYVAVEKAESTITNHFVVISNTSEENAGTVRVGAERVIRARFEDARFYFEEDRKVPLHTRMEYLKKVTFHERLGSLYDKTERIVSIAAFLADRVFPALKEHVVRAARLAKTDLITGVVREFPELQGIMGKYYALHDGESKEVADALEEQYLPAYSGGALPRTDAGALLSIADKIDTVAGFFSIGIMPTGSEDPFALRRQALGIIAIMMDKSIDVPVQDLVDKAFGTLPHGESIDVMKEQMLRFVRNRVEAVLSDLGFSSDFVQSALPVCLRIPLFSVRERLDALKRCRDHPAYCDFLVAMKRVNNIIPKSPMPSVRPELLLEEQEISLSAKLNSMRGEIESLVDSKRYDDAVILLFSLTEAVNRFFDHILVMDKREEIKQNRLSLLQDIWQTVSALADFSKLSSN